MSANDKEKHSEIPSVEGYLEKRGAIRKNWKKRYFQLEGASMIYYAKKEELDSKKPQPKGCIPLHPKTVIKVTTAANQSPSDSCEFEIDCTEACNRIFYLRAPSPIHCNHWVQSLTKYLAILYYSLNENGDAFSTTENAQARWQGGTAADIRSRRNGFLDFGSRPSVDTLQKELQKRDEKIQQLRRELDNKRKEIDEVGESYFASLGVITKMNLISCGGSCSQDLHVLYEEVKKEGIGVQDWPNWLSTQLEKGS